MNAADMATKRARRAAEGKCADCEETRLPGHSLCRTHFDAQTRRLKAWNRKRKRAGRCFCGDPAKRGRERCPTCLAIENRRQKEVYRELRQAGICTRCRRKAMRGQSLCRVCRNRRMAAYRDMAARRLRVRTYRGSLLRRLAPELVF